MKPVILLAFASMFLIPAVHAACPSDGFTGLPLSTPTADFDLDDVNGLATHIPTGLVWKRCLEGQSWNAGGCSGSELPATWSSALATAASHSYAGETDWRLPNLKELRSIMEDRCHAPSINTTVFPDTPTGASLWTSSPYANAARAWIVNSTHGYADHAAKDSPGLVRLVRGGP